ncbi:MAG: tRNA 2-thiouridine(34) synthase MnmA [Hyphomicrobiaceae bacterium]|nr:tRNA 2-thiouridine(34) synthase MnmA [Hyphomicrobiaceae bacterium]
MTARGATASSGGGDPAARPVPRRVVVAMSGGVDSSVVAALLKRAGHDVVGITLQLYDHGEATASKGSCCAGQDIHDARRVAEALGIPHYVLDYEHRFERSVISSFADSYLAGETPIPCVTCNQQIKFRELLDTATELGADVLATGHYIQRRDRVDGPELRRALDAERDQSYFLFATTREQLSRLWFPLGALRKAEVRELARDFSLPVAEKPDSQDICFVPAGRYADVIERLRPGAAEPGDIVHVDGRVLGRHDGVMRYTIGQRRGLKLAGDGPLYVVRLEAERRRVVVGPRDCLRTEVLELRDVNWLGSPVEAETARRRGLQVRARIRSTHAPIDAVLVLDEPPGRARVLLPGGEHGVAPGQACVLYEDAGAEARILGGGWIARTQAAMGEEVSRLAAAPVAAGLAG